MKNKKPPWERLKEFLQRGARYYREHPSDLAALTISIIALAVALRKD